MTIPIHTRFQVVMSLLPLHDAAACRMLDWAAVRRWGGRGIPVDFPPFRPWSPDNGPSRSRMLRGSHMQMTRVADYQDFQRCRWSEFRAEGPACAGRRSVDA